MDWTKINLNNLQSLPLERKGKLPTLSAIYFCVNGQQVLYIGQSGNLNRRWRNHHRYHQLVTQENIQVYWIECVDTKQRFMAERLLIQHYKPPLNGSQVRLKVALSSQTRLHTQKYVLSKISLISKCFDETLKKYGITGATLSQKVGITPSHISQFRNSKGGAVSHRTLDKMLQAIEELAPGAKLYFCLLLAGKNPTEFLVQSNYPDWQSLVTSATPAQRAEILHALADSMLPSQGEVGQDIELEKAR